MTDKEGREAARETFRRFADNLAGTLRTAGHSGAASGGRTGGGPSNGGAASPGRRMGPPAAGGATGRRRK